MPNHTLQILRLPRFAGLMLLLDFIFAKNLTASQPTVTQTNTSDHWPVTREFRLQ